MSSPSGSSSTSVASVRVSIALPMKLYEVLKRRCEELGLEFSLCIAKAVVEMVERETRRGGR